MGRKFGVRPKCEHGRCSNDMRHREAETGLPCLRGICSRAVLRRDRLEEVHPNSVDSETCLRRAGLADKEENKT